MAKMVKIIRDLILFCSDIVPYFWRDTVLLDDMRCSMGKFRGFGKLMRCGSVKLRSSVGLWDLYFLFLLNYSRKVVNIIGVVIAYTSDLMSS